MGKASSKVILVAHTPEPEKLAAIAGRRCYSASGNSELLAEEAAKDSAAFVKKVAGMGHVTIIEHAVFTFAVEGASRSLLSQITRHRLASFSVQSQRYVGETSSKNSGAMFDYVVPPQISALGWEAEQEFVSQLQQIQVWYDDWVRKLGGDRNAYEDARFILPNAAETKFIFSMNARELFYFLTLRCCRRAQWEIRQLAEQLLRLVQPVAPGIFAQAGPACLRGACPEGELTCGRIDEVRLYFKNLGE